MYSLEKRKKAVALYYKYGKRISAVIRELGYPKRPSSIRNWVREIEETGKLHKQRVKRAPKYSQEQKKSAVDFYLRHGRSIKFTLQSLGYPCKTLLKQWIDELSPGVRPVVSNYYNPRRYTRDEKTEVIADFINREVPALEFAESHGISRNTIYKWKKDLTDGINIAMEKKNPICIKSIEEAEAIIAGYEENIARLREENRKLEERRRRAEIQVAVLEKAEEILKKEKGISLENLNNREKAMVIDALKKSFSVKELAKALNISKSSYCYNSRALKKDKYADVKACIRRLFIENNCSYGYRRMHCLLCRLGMVISEKVVRRLMKEEQLRVVFIKKKKYSSYAGEITPAVPNLLKRDFHADHPNEKWLTDITEFSLPKSKVYLSPLIDCYDGLVVSWAISASPNSELVTTMLENGISTLKAGESPIIHSDRGCHYRWPSWIDMMNNAGLTRSMSRKGCSPDNSACEGFFGRLKNEMFYNRSWNNTTVDEFIEKLDDYIHWYNEKRIKLSLGGLSPLEFRLKNKENKSIA